MVLVTSQAKYSYRIKKGYKLGMEEFRAQIFEFDGATGTWNRVRNNQHHSSLGASSVIFKFFRDKGITLPDTKIPVVGA